jgi:hypothetical protein
VQNLQIASLLSDSCGETFTPLPEMAADKTRPAACVAFVAIVATLGNFGCCLQLHDISNADFVSNTHRIISQSRLIQI